MALAVTTQHPPIVTTSESKAQTVKNWLGKHKVEIGAVALGTAAIVGAVIAGVLTGGLAFAALGLAGLSIAVCGIIKGVVTHAREKKAEKEAATNIQRVYRGHIARNDVKVLSQIQIKKDEIANAAKAVCIAAETQGQKQAIESKHRLRRNIAMGVGAAALAGLAATAAYYWMGQPGASATPLDFRNITPTHIKPTSRLCLSAQLPDLWWPAHRALVTDPPHYELLRWPTECCTIK